MLTLVLVGASTTRMIETGDGKQWVYTPARLREEKSESLMTVHFIGAGPGAPDLITVRGLKLIEACPVCLYAGSWCRKRSSRPPRKAPVCSTPRP